MTPEEGFALLREPSSWRLTIGRRAVPRRMWLVRAVAIAASVAVIVAAVGVGWAIREVRGHPTPPVAAPTSTASAVPVGRALKADEFTMAKNAAIAVAINAPPEGHDAPLDTTAWPEYVTTATAIATTRTDASRYTHTDVEGSRPTIVVELTGSFAWVTAASDTVSTGSVMTIAVDPATGQREETFWGDTSAIAALPPFATVLYPIDSATSCSPEPATTAPLSAAGIREAESNGLTLTGIAPLPAGVTVPGDYGRPDEAGVAFASNPQGYTEMGTVNGKVTWTHRRIFIFEWNDVPIHPGLGGSSKPCGHASALVDATTGDFLVQTEG